MDNTQQEQALAQLREAIEKVVDRKMKTPKDFDFLSGCIFDMLHQNISATTLKRIWGYLAEPVVPRPSTLNLLAQFVGVESWEAFCQQSLNPSPTQENEPDQPLSDNTPHQKRSLSTAWRIVLIVLPLLFLAGGIVLYLYLKSQPDIINFADPAVKAICVTHWDTDEDGELSMPEAAQVTDLEDCFKEDTTITSFDELQYFTGLSAINKQAFLYCQNLKSVIIPDNVKTLEPGAFDGCTSLLSIYIPKNVTSINPLAFSTTPDMESIIVDKDNPIYDSRNNCNAIIETASNRLVAGCRTTVIPKDVTILGTWAFGGRWFLKLVKIPANISVIEYGAFAWNVHLNTVVSEREEPVRIEKNAFESINEACTLVVPKGTKDAYIAAGWTEDIFRGGIIEADH